MATARPIHVGKPVTKAKKVFLADLLPADAAFQIMEGEVFIRLRDAPRLGKIHPFVLQMGRQLLNSIGNKGVAYLLTRQSDKILATTLAKLFRNQLGKYAKASDGRKLRAHAVVSNGAEKIVCWYTLLK